MARSDKSQRCMLAVALAAAAVLLVRFALDFIEQMSFVLSIPFIALVAAAILVAFANIFIRPRQSIPAGQRERAFFLAAIPIAFLASSLDCMGLSLRGCSTFCTFVKLAWIPLIATLCIAYFFAEKRWLLSVVLLMSFIPLWPHCVCYNVGNGWWMDRIGRSPECYVWGFTVSVISVSALRRGRGQWASVLVCAAIISGATAFFISHHYFHFPW